MTIKQLIENGALFVCNHSGGKDSQIMYLYLREIVPASQLVVIHAHLPGVEWEGTEEHIRATIADEPFYIVQAAKTFLGMVKRRGMFPSPSTRQCTSDLKRDPIDKRVRAICEERGISLVVNCMGLRAQESSGRAKKEVFKIRKKMTTQTRTVYDWLPIHDLQTTEVFQGIKDFGQEPFWVYAAGMSRKSCCFCIMASEGDLYTASKLRPELAQKYTDLEREIGQTMLMPTKSKGRRYLDQVLADYEKTIKL